MRLYSLADASGVDYDGKHYAPGKDGGFDLPDELMTLLHGSAVRGVRQWETDVERQHRLIAEELERRKDPATLLDAVQQLVKAAQTVSAPAEPAKTEPAKATAKTAAKGAEK